QAAREGLAIQRMTANPRAAASELLRSELALPDDAGAADGEPIELTMRMMTLTLAAVGKGEDPPSCVPARAADILYARRSSGSVTTGARARSGVRSASKWSWVDAGDLGLWRVEPDGEGPLLPLVPAVADDLAGEIAAVWDGASAD